MEVNKEKSSNLRDLRGSDPIEKTKPNRRPAAGNPKL